MQTFSYKLLKDLAGRPAMQLNWALGNFPFSIHILAPDGRTISAKSLVGLLSAHLQKDNMLVISTYTEEQLDKVKKELEKLDFIKK